MCRSAGSHAHDPALAFGDDPMLLGYNTNGFSDHRLEDAAAVLAGLGCRSLAITLDRALLDPPDRRGVPAAASRIRQVMADFGLRATIETGARFILDPRHKHQPTLLSASAQGRQKRIEYIKAAIDIAADTGADCVSLWSGAPDDDADASDLLDRLIDSLSAVLDHAQLRGVRLGFEPEPGMFIDTMDRFYKLYRRVHHPLFGLTLDVGHVHCLGDGDIVAHILMWKDQLFNVHVEDMRRGVHEHLMIGEGDVPLPEVFEALRTIDYTGPVHVELPRHSHNAVETAGKAMARLLELSS